MNGGMQATLDRSVSDLIVVGDSRLAIQQYMGVIACRKNSLPISLADHKEIVSRLN